MDSPIKPLRIECDLAGPWIPSVHGVHLDGVLARVALQRLLVDEGAMGVLDESAQLKELYDQAGAELPLQRHCPDESSSSVWCASMFFPIGSSVSRRVFFTAKTPAMDMLCKIDQGLLSPAGGARIDTLRGWSKAGLWWQEVRHVAGLQAWCLGDPEQLQDLLSDVRALGSKTRLGFGGVLVDAQERPLWRVMEDPQAASRWKLRNLPAPPEDDVPGVVRLPVTGALASPYWRPTGQVWTARMPELERQSSRSGGLDLGSAVAAAV